MPRIRAAGLDDVGAVLAVRYWLDLH